MNHPDVVVRKTALEFLVSAKAALDDDAFERMVVCNLTIHQKRLVHTFSMNQ